MHQIVSPSILNENSFEYLLNQLPDVSTPEKEILIDLSLTESIDFYSVLATLELGLYLTKNSFFTTLHLPKNTQVLGIMANSGLQDYVYLGFKEIIGQLPEPQTEASTILKLTPIEKHTDIHDVAFNIRKKINQDVEPVPSNLWDNIIVVVSEICQNIPEHSQDKGFVLVQTQYQKHLRKKFITIVVMDSGIGIRNSLDKKFSAVFRSQWSDHMALHKTLFEGVSRHDDPGRGNGIIRTRELVVEKYRGNMSLRSGTAKLWGKIATWEIERFFRRPLTFLPGTQVYLNLPLS